jgi:hypothetical protein
LILHRAYIHAKYVSQEDADEKERQIMKSTWQLIVAAAAIIIALVFLSSLGKKAPFIPHDDRHEHASTREECVACHAPGKRAPLKTGHPPKEQCLICHKREKTVR